MPHPPPPPPPPLSGSHDSTQVLPVFPEPAFPAAFAIPFGADALGVGPEALVLSLPPHGRAPHLVVSGAFRLCLRHPCPSLAQATLFTGAFQGFPASACVRSTRSSSRPVRLLWSAHAFPARSALGHGPLISPPRSPSLAPGLCSSWHTPGVPSLGLLPLSPQRPRHPSPGGLVSAPLPSGLHSEVPFQKLLQHSVSASPLCLTCHIPLLSFFCFQNTAFITS